MANYGVRHQAADLHGIQVSRPEVREERPVHSFQGLLGACINTCTAAQRPMGTRHSTKTIENLKKLIENAWNMHRKCVIEGVEDYSSLLGGGLM